MSSVSEIKREVRREYRQKRKDLNAEAKRLSDDLICRNITESCVFASCESLLCYAPMADEVDIMPVAEVALRLGKKVYFPICHTESCTLSFHRVTDLSELRAGHYGILTPDESSPVYENESSLSLCLVPGLVFDTFGYRVGYGKGYYDRFLKDFCGTSAGVVYSIFKINSVPRDQYDLAVDLIITERNVTAPLED